MINELKLPFGSWDWHSIASQQDHQRSKCRKKANPENLPSHCPPKHHSVQQTLIIWTSQPGWCPGILVGKVGGGSKKEEKWGNRIDGMQKLKQMFRSTLWVRTWIRGQVPAPRNFLKSWECLQCKPMVRVRAHISAQMFPVPAIQGALEEGLGASS